MGGQCRDGKHTATTGEADTDAGGHRRPATQRRHPFYTRLNHMLGTHDVDEYVEGLCKRFYAEDGRPGLPPGRYFRLLLIGYFEGLDAGRAIAGSAAIRLGGASFSGWCCPGTLSLCRVRIIRRRVPHVPQLV